MNLNTQRTSSIVCVHIDLLMSVMWHVCVRNELLTCLCSMYTHVMSYCINTLVTPHNDIVRKQVAIQFPHMQKRTTTCTYNCLPLFMYKHMAMSSMRNFVIQTIQMKPCSWSIKKHAQPFNFFHVHKHFYLENFTYTACPTLYSLILIRALVNNYNTTLLYILIDNLHTKATN